jgi:Dam-replacing HTH domain
VIFAVRPAGFGISSNGSATVPVAVRNVPWRTIPKRVRRDAGRRRRDARAPHFTRELEKLHPDNRHVKDKIRQQLQVLRDAGLLLQIGRGIWRLP